MDKATYFFTKEGGLFTARGESSESYKWTYISLVSWYVPVVSYDHKCIGTSCNHLFLRLTAPMIIN